MIDRKATSELLIHLDRLDNNVAVIRDRIGSRVQLMAVVKDNAYGHGAIEVARHIEDRVEWFCVSEIEEGIALRENNIQRPILVFEVPRSSFASAYVKYNLTATVSDLDTIPGLEPGTSYHILFDSGMRRLGLLPGEISSIKQQIEQRGDVTCTGLYTHFANADRAADERVHAQYSIFQEIRKAFPEEMFTHAANTGTIFNYSEEYLFDGVRPGVALSGYSPSLEEISGLKPIMEWSSYVAQVREVQKGDYVGYGNDWRAEQDGFIATVPVGYADSVSRMLKNRIRFDVNGKLYAQVGNITMDYLMIFSSTNDFRRGDKVILLDTEENNAYYWAKLTESLPYEITTQLPEKISRVFK